MNRFFPGLLADSEHLQGDGPSGNQEHLHAQHELATASGLTFEHSVFLPAHFESRHAYPLLIWLHSAGGDEDQAAEVLPAISQRNYMGAGLRGNGLAEAGFCWKQTATAIETATNQVVDLIDWLENRFTINPERIFVAGAGCGGTMAFRLAFRMPHLFAGAASFNGAVPDSENPLDNLRDCRMIPLFWMQNRQSKILPEPELCGQLKLLHIAGFDVTLRQYPGVDELAEPPLADFNTWVMEQLASQPDSGIVL